MVFVSALITLARYNQPSIIIMLSADLHPGVVDQYVDCEVAKGRILGLVAVSVEAARAGVGLHINRMGVVL